MTLTKVRLGLAFTGMGLALAAIALQIDLLVWTAIGVLMVSLVLRLIEKRESEKARKRES